MTTPITVPTFPDLEGRSVFVTGGGSGIGAALTEGFLRQGARVAFCQRSDAAAFVDRMEAETGNRPLFLACDLTDLGALESTLAKAAEANGPVSVLVNNAANDQRHSALDVDADFWDRSIAINLRSYFFAAKAVIPGMQAMGGGSIVNFSSTSYMMGQGIYPLYTTSNGAITALTRSLAREFGPDRIRVNAIAPGWVMTEKQKEKWVTDEGLAEHMRKQCLPDTLDPIDIVPGCLFLASSASRALTGQIVPIDGGVVVTG